MAAAFPPHADPNCPDPNLPEIPFSSIIPEDPLTPPEPIIEVDLFSFPLPIPETPLGCYCPIVQFTATQDPDPNGITATAQSIPGINGCCEPIITLDLNIPAPSLALCQDKSIGGSITRTGGELTFNSSVIPPPGQTQEDIFNGVVSTGAVPPPTTIQFAVDMSAGVVTDIPNFFRGCLLTFTSGANVNTSREIEEYFFDGNKWRVVFLAAWSNPVAESDSFIISCGGSLLVGPCDTLTLLDLNIPCPQLSVSSGSIIADLSATNSFGGSLSSSGPKCDSTLNLSLSINTPTCGVVMGPGGPPQLMDPNNPIQYSVNTCETPVVSFTAENGVEALYSAALLYKPVPVGTIVLLMHSPNTTPNVKFFFAVEPEDTICTQPPCVGTPAAPAAPAGGVADVIPSLPVVSPYRIRLWPYPAGKLKCASSSSPTFSHEIVCPDPLGIGWLPVSSPIVPTTGQPVGAKFWYNFNTHVEEYVNFTLEQLYQSSFDTASFSRSYLHMTVDGSNPPEMTVATDTDNLLDEDPTVVYTDQGIWWMKDTWGNVPWADALALVQNDSCLSYGYNCPPASYIDMYTFTYGYGYILTSVLSSTGSPSNLFDKRITLSLYYNGI